MTPDTQAIIGFLGLGQHLLVAIPSDPENLPRDWPIAYSTKPAATIAHWVDDPNEAAEWAAYWNKHGAGLYWTANNAPKGWRKKPSKSEILSARCLFVDDDDRNFESGGLPDGVPEPTIVIDSGNGLQLVWVLDGPTDIAAELHRRRNASRDPFDHRTPGWKEERECAEQRWREYERYNRWLAQGFDADHCWNVDRLLRLPGTINWPSKAKRARGRVPVMSRLVSCNERCYPLASFGQAEPTPVRRSRPVELALRERFTPNDVRGLVGDINLVRAILTGERPNRDKSKPLDRSRELFAVCCGLMECGVQDDQIYTVICDEQFPISAHVLDQDLPARAAERVIERARQVVDERKALIFERLKRFEAGGAS